MNSPRELPIQISHLLLVVLSPIMTVTKSTTDTTLETEITEDDISGTESHVKTFYTMHICENIHHKISKNLKNML